MSFDDGVDYVEYLKTVSGKRKKKTSEKVAQCWYCSNSSNEGEGAWRGNLWICKICLDEFVEEKAGEEK